MDQRLIGIAAALLSAAAWAAGAILYKKLGERASAASLNLVKSVLSVIMLLAALMVTGFGPMDSEAFFLLGFSGLLGITLGDTFFFRALQDLSPHTMILLSMLGQVLTVIFAVVLLGESPSAMAWVGIALVTLGVGVVLWARFGGDGGQDSRRGVGYGLLAVLCMAVAIIVAKEGISRVSPLEATFVRLAWGVAGLAAWGVAQGSLKQWVAPFANTRLVKDIFFAVCVATFGGFYLSHVAIKYIDVAIANTLNSTEPLFVLPMAAIFLKEKITVNALMGTVLALSGVAFIFIG